MNNLSCAEIFDKYPLLTFETSGLRSESQSANDLPPLLYYRGDISLLNTDNNIAAVVGSRDISERGRAVSRNIAQVLCKRRIIVLNGLAMGCDAEALEAATECGGKCIAIMPCGLDQITPKANEQLAFDLLEKGGCLISEYPSGVTARKENYVERDRLQALFSDLVIVVESREGSGTWHTVDFAKRYKKIVACYIEKNKEFSKGNEILIEKKKAYPLKDNTAMDYVIDLSKKRYEQVTLPV